MCRTALHCTAQQTRLGHWGAYINWACCSDRLRRPGVLCIDLHSTNADLVLSGGADSTAVIYNRATKKVLSEQALAASQTGSMRVGRHCVGSARCKQVSATLSGHSKKVSAVQFHPTEDIVLTCSYDKTAKVWKPSDRAPAGRHPLVGGSA